MSTKLNVKLITDNLADELIARMQHASGIYIMTSFIMQSGVKLLAPHLKLATERGAEVRMLAGDYLYITQPEGLRALCEVDPRIEKLIIDMPMSMWSGAKGSMRRFEETILLYSPHKP
ncbi:hypothetical protein MHI01_13555 [Paenibacillus sp. FSL M7-0656]|uniref:hypothetical protein n=1 Tax=Paenibacillus sp. FSL M7-0656 TaxID=2921534 RepID=UPI0030F582E2